MKKFKGPGLKTSKQGIWARNESMKRAWMAWGMVEWHRDLGLQLPSETTGLWFCTHSGVGRAAFSHEACRVKPL